MKKVVLTGRKQSPVMPWRFWLVLTVEEPKPAARHPEQLCVVGVDVGWWRVPDKSKIRIAMTWDGKRHRELLLPLSFWKKELGEVSIAHITSLSSQRDLLLESCKQKLAELLPEHPRAKNKVAWQRTRSGGLVRFLHELDAATPAAELLRIWKRDNDQLLRQQLMLENAFNHRRKWFNRNFAAEFAREYHVVGIENLNLVQMSSREKTKGEEKRGLRRLAQRRKYAALGELFDAIENPMAKAGGRVVRVPPSSTTHTCSACGKPFDTGIDGRLGVCPDGHEADRDKNASINIFSQTCRAL
ncbi:MAG: transposase [Firmicutes bacterium]|nr:transposase [Bacillota bacterium]